MSHSAQIKIPATYMRGGTSKGVFFRLVEGWTWVDSYFFAVVTLSTVGYGNLVPATALGKVGTTVFIFVGLGIFAAAIQQIAAATLQRRRINPRDGKNRTN